MPGRDTRTRWQGVFARHKHGCGVEQLAPGSALGAIARACTCRPSYYAKVYDRSRQRYLATKRCADVAAARDARNDLLDALGKGQLPQEGPLRLRDAHERFIAACSEGRALNKHGRRYKRSAWEDIDECLRKHVLPRFGGRRLADLRRADVQRLVDDLTPKMSGSRVRSIVNALRSLYRWAQDRELVVSDPAARVRLPAMNATARDRVATPVEFAALMAALEIEDALPYALAAYAMGRRAQIQRLRWRDVDLRAGAIEWGVEPEGRKSPAARRVVPTVKPLLTLLKRAWIGQGRPPSDYLVCPPRRDGSTGLLHTEGLRARATRAWQAKKLQPIGLHECRHTAATWLDAAGVSPKVASVLMGHATPDHQPGAAQITLARYTHVMPGALETARFQLDSWLAAQLSATATTG
jgi:integrase